MIFTTDLLFKILNFIIICVLVIYAMRRYGILYIMSLVRLAKQKKDEEVVRHDTLIQDAIQIQQQSKEQEHDFIAMKQRFQMWADREHADYLEQQKWAASYQQKILHNQMIKLHNMQQQQIIAKQMPQLLQDVCDDVTEKFEKNPELQKKYLEHVVWLITESNKS